MNEKLTTEQIVEIIRKYGDALPSGGFHLSSVYFEAVAKEITTNTAEDEVTVEQKEQRRVDDKMIRLFHMILDSQIKLYDAFQANPPEDERYQTALEVQAEYLKELNKYSKEKSWEEGQSQSGLFMWLGEKITGG